MDINEIKKVFADNGVPLFRDDAWQVQGTWVIKHKALERLSAAIKIKWEVPTVLRAERDEAVILVGARRGDKDYEIYEWSIGEALIVKDGTVGGNYKVSGKQSAYPFAMAEKRAKDRVIIKISGLHGAYSEEEADDFKDNSKKDYSGNDVPAQSDQNSQADQEQRPPAADQGQQQSGNVVNLKSGPEGEELVANLKEKIRKLENTDAVTAFMLDKENAALMKGLSKELSSEVREFAKSRLKELGWDAKAQGAKKAS